MLMTTLAIKNDAINMHAKGDSHVKHFKVPTLGP